MESAAIQSDARDALAFCQGMIDRMLRLSQTKFIFPIITLGLLNAFEADGKQEFSDSEIRRLYEAAVRRMRDFLGHDLHIGGKYYDAYPSRNLPRYSVVKALGGNRYQLLAPYTLCAASLISWIPDQIKSRIEERLGTVPSLGDALHRASCAGDQAAFISLIEAHLDRNPTNFEVFSFAVLKVHLEKFACRIYRDTRTSAHDRGVDLSTNFGVVYQIKKMKIFSKADADNIYAELKGNFDGERIRDGNVILVIDDISKEVKDYLIDMKIQSISKRDVLSLTRQFEDPEDREKVLRIAYEEFRREYSSDIKG